MSGRLGDRLALAVLLLLALLLIAFAVYTLTDTVRRQNCHGGYVVKAGKVTCLEKTERTSSAGR